MPNTLVHFAIQGSLSRAVLRNADQKWILLGAVVPDIPWILRHVVGMVAPFVNAYDLILYVSVQASLAFCIVLSGAFSLASTRPRLVFALLASNSMAHLIIDATQRKWGNGVHLFAPVSWRMFNLDLVWPEHILFYSLTVVGLFFTVWVLVHASGTTIRINVLSVKRVVAATILLGIYLIVPVALVDGPAAWDAHSTETLRKVEERVGRTIVLDRVSIEQTTDGYQVTTYAGEVLNLVGDFVAEPGMVSLIGSFQTSKTVRVLELHQNDAWFRDAASVVGLFLLVLIWLKAWVRKDFVVNAPPMR